jgi:hypothetical protein
MIDEKLQSRTEEDIYLKGLKDATNCLIEPNGNVKKRYGTDFIVELPEAQGIYKIVPFEYSVDDKFLLVFYALTLDIYYNNVKVYTTATVYTADDIRNIRYAQSTNNMVICDGTHKPYQLSLTTVPNVWSLTEVTFINVPSYDFNKNYFHASFTPSGVYGSLTITASAGVFSSALVGGLFIGNGAVARITGYTSSTEITVQTLGTTFFFTDTGEPNGAVIAIAGVNAVVREPSWSNTRGWPTNPCLHANRLWFGGTVQRPQGIWGSVVGDYFNFNEGTGQPDQAISVNIDTQQLNNIEHIVAANTLEVLTNTGIYVASQPDNTDQLTPSLVFSLPTKEGSSDVPPVFIDNQVFYVQRGGKIIRNFVYDFDIRTYNSDNVSLYSSSIIKFPQDSCVLKYNDSDSANYVFFINNDGTMAAFQSEQAEGIKAWTYATTDGEFTNCCSLDQTVYFVVKRVIDGDIKYYLEQINSNDYMDCQIIKEYVAPTSTVTGLDHLEGKTVHVVRDGVIENDKIVANGQITSDRPGNEFKIGLNISSRIGFLPLSLNSMSGNSIYTKKTIRRIYVDFYQTIGLKLDGVLLSYFQLNNYILGSIVEAPTGISVENYVKDWEPRQDITLTHDYPTNFTLCGIGYEITETSIGGM